jgi:hypothetical protein
MPDMHERVPHFLFLVWSYGPMGHAEKGWRYKVHVYAGYRYGEVRGY